ncbi:MAG: hypothetical protein IBX57_00775 [Gammaproteobacteria bacterium]|nr:hypothetical protein [Gammaproteobacteria bacterium]
MTQVKNIQGGFSTGENTKIFKKKKTSISVKDIKVVEKKKKKSPFRGFYYWGIFEGESSALKLGHFADLPANELSDMEQLMALTPTLFEMVTISYVEHDDYIAKIYGFGKTKDLVTLSNDDLFTPMAQGIFDEVEEGIEPSDIVQRSIIIAPVTDGMSIFPIVVRLANSLELSHYEVGQIADYLEVDPTNIGIEI